MPTYEIEQQELHTMKYRVQANSEADAIKLLLDGNAELVDDNSEFIDRKVRVPKGVTDDASPDTA